MLSGGPQDPVALSKIAALMRPSSFQAATIFPLGPQAAAGAAALAPGVESICGAVQLTGERWPDDPTSSVCDGEPLIQPCCAGAGARRTVRSRISPARSRPCDDAL